MAPSISSPTAAPASENTAKSLGRGLALGIVVLVSLLSVSMLSQVYNDTQYAQPLYSGSQATCVSIPRISGPVAATPREASHLNNMVQAWVEPADDADLLITDVAGYMRFPDTDSTPGYGDIPELTGNYKNASECATFCDRFEVEKKLACTGFIVRHNQKDSEAITCYFKRIALGKVESHGATAYFRPARFVKSVPRLPIVYGVLTAKKFLRTRLWTAYETWLRDVESVVFLEDAEDVRKEFDAVVADMKASDHLKNVATTAAFITEPVDKTQRSFNGAWKNLPILEHLAKSHPDSPWYAMVDDDSFIAQHNMNILVSSSYRHQAQMYYLGVVFSGQDGVLFQQGGAGILYNNVAMKQFMGHYDSCLAKCKEWAGDIRLGCCAKIANVALSSDNSFWSQTIFQSLVRDERHKRSPFPVSFHNMRNQTWVQDLHQALDIIGGDDEARGGKLAASCKTDLFSATNTCRLWRQLLRRLARHKQPTDGSPVRIGEAPVAFSWGGSGSGNITTLVPAVPITWDFLDAQFRIGWWEKYGGEDEKLYRKPKLF